MYISLFPGDQVRPRRRPSVYLSETYPPTRGPFLWLRPGHPALSISYIPKVRGRTSAGVRPPRGTISPCQRPRNSPACRSSPPAELRRRAHPRSPRSRTLGTLSPWAVRGEPWAKCSPPSETSPGTRTESAAHARRTHKGPFREALIRIPGCQKPRHSPGRALPTHLGTLPGYSPKTHIKRHFRPYARLRPYRPRSSFFCPFGDI